MQTKSERIILLDTADGEPRIALFEKDGVTLPHLEVESIDLALRKLRFQYPIDTQVSSEIYPYANAVTIRNGCVETYLFEQRSYFEVSNDDELIGVHIVHVHSDVTLTSVNGQVCKGWVTFTDLTSTSVNSSHPLYHKLLLGAYVPICVVSWSDRVEAYK